MDRSKSWNELRSVCIAILSDRQARSSEEWVTLWTRFIEHPGYRRDLKRISWSIIAEEPKVHLAQGALMEAAMLLLARRLRRHRSPSGIELIARNFRLWVQMVITLDCHQAVRSCGQLISQVATRSSDGRDRPHVGHPSSIRVHEAVQALDEPHRTVLALHAAGWNVNEIAEELQTTAELTRSTLAHAVRRLRRALAKSA